MFYFYKVKGYDDVDGEFTETGLTYGNDFSEVSKKLSKYYGDIIDYIALQETDDEILIKDEIMDEFKDGDENE